MQSGRDRVGGGQERPGGGHHSAPECAARESPGGIGARPERTRPAQPVDRGALAAETLPEPPRGIVGVVRDAQLLRSREELTHQPVPDAPTVPGRNHELSRYGHADGLAPKQHATRHYADEPPPPPPPPPPHQTRGGPPDPRGLGEKPPPKKRPSGPPPPPRSPG